jgi:LuxR family transcriptional regulator, quorum-sensing system regulator CviR
MHSSEALEVTACLSGSDALTLLEVINSTLSIRDAKAFTSIYPKIQELFPFDFAGVIAGHLETDGRLIIDYRCNISYPEKWFQEYEFNDYINLDKGTKYALKTHNSMHWSLPQNVVDVLCHDVPENIISLSLECVPEEIKSLDMDFGLKEGYACGLGPFRMGLDGTVFGFSGGSMRFDLRAFAILETLVPHLHSAFSNVCGNKRPDTEEVSISTREKEVLHWLKEGKSSWDISVILAISERTVNYHIYNAMAKLGAINRAQAVAIATHLGLVEFT